EAAGQRGAVRNPARARRRPLAGRLAVDAARRVAQREGRGDPFHEYLSRPEEEIDVAGDPLLRRAEQGLDVAAHRIEMLTLVNEIAVDGGDRLLQPQLPAGQHELFELPVRGDQHLGGRGFEGHPAPDAEDGLAEMDPAADAVTPRRLLHRFDQLDRRELLAVPRRGDSGPESKRGGG